MHSASSLRIERREGRPRSRAWAALLHCSDCGRTVHSVSGLGVSPGHGLIVSPHRTVNRCSSRRGLLIEPMLDPFELLNGLTEVQLGSWPSPFNALAIGRRNLELTRPGLAGTPTSSWPISFWFGRVKWRAGRSHKTHWRTPSGPWPGTCRPCRGCASCRNRWGSWWSSSRSPTPQRRGAGS